jgi:hypothetical protein
VLVDLVNTVFWLNPDSDPTSAKPGFRSDVKDFNISQQWKAVQKATVLKCEINKF